MRDRYKFHLIPWLFLGVLAIPVCLASYEYAIERVWLSRNRPLGQMVNIGGYRLHLNCSGRGAPGVILEAGLGDSSLIWHDVQRSISQFTRVCSYDRAGLGWSDSSPLARDPLNETTELHLLLENAGITDRVVLVGHSMGGDLVRLYAYRFPKQVAGIVLVEPSNEDRWSLITGLRTQWEGFRRDCRYDSWKARFGWMRLKPQPLEEYPHSVRTLAEALSSVPTAEAANCGEIHSIIGDGPQQVGQANTLWNIPLIVVTAGQNIFADDTPLPDRGKAGNLWKEMQANTAHVSSRGEQVFAMKSSHFVQYDEPDVVVTQVHRLLNEIAAQ